ncbi:MAG: GNAT family N-acetyltransferase [Chitinophagaceae bacterium]|nr:GNAT family N-acetyltransferase [Chitinophagaceae bacterium]
MLSLKKATAADIPLIRELTFAIWPQTYSSIISQQQIDYMLDMMYSPASLQKQMEEEGCTFIIVYDEGEPVAFASYAQHPADNETEPKIWKLNKIYILPSQQGKGTGKFIIRYIVDEIKSLHAKALQLQVNRENMAKDFYEKLGFKIIKTADFDIGKGYFMNDYVMELVL